MDKHTTFADLKRAARTGVLGFVALFAVAACGGTSAPAADPSGEAKTTQGMKPEHAHAHAHEGHEGEHHHGRHHGAGHHHRFDDAAKWSAVFDDPARDAWQKPARVVELLALQPGMAVADVGAGTGYFLPYLSKAVGPTGKVIGQDLEASMVKWMSDRAAKDKLANVEARQGSPDDPKLDPASLDRILIVDVWHHVSDRPAFAKKLSAALKPGGAVYIVDFTKESPHGPPPAARLSAEDVAADFVAAGLKPTVHASAGLPYQYVVSGAR